jgi:prepilin-type N-terminal cleavage/methylation domain-containing protein/prepilin-type processing-associated H-X9-DG protein
LFIWPVAIGRAERLGIVSYRLISVRRCAFSLVEVLVVIAILAVLMGLLLPAVQRVRETSHQTNCRNNLRQIGLALQTYYVVRGCLPPAYTWDTSSPPPRPARINTYPGWGWAVHILPFLERNTITETIQWDHGVEDADMTEVRTTIIKAYVCPSDTGAGIFTVYHIYGGVICDAATNSYAGCHGYNEPIGETPYKGSGIFYRNSSIRLNEIRDGTSTTLAIGERAALFCPVPWAGAISMGTVRTNPDSPSFVAAVEEAPLMTTARTSDVPLNDYYSLPYDYYSPHPLAGMFLFADGSVRALSFTISLDVWAAIATRAGGETISVGDF